MWANLLNFSFNMYLAYGSSNVIFPIYRYHWMCVGISSEPDESQDWYCMRCVSEIKKETNSGKKNVKEKKKR